MSENLQVRSSSQNYKKPGEPEHTDEKDDDGNETAEPSLETYTEMTDEPRSETGLSTRH